MKEKPNNAIQLFSHVSSNFWL